MITATAAALAAWMAIDNCQPFSLIRVGDGEARLLAWPDIAKDDLELPLRRWFGASEIPYKDIGWLSDQLRQAVTNADFIGVPDAGHQVRDKWWSEVMRHVEYDADLVDMNVHFQWHESGLYAEILQDLNFLGIISCRDIGDRLKKIYNIHEVRWHEISSEFTDKNPMALFDRLAGEIEPGMIYLVGAGIIGKLLCQRIKEQGGIGLDVGSIFDGWAGVPTRGYMNGKRLTYTLPAVRDVTVDIIVPYLENRERLQRCLDSIETNTPYKHRVLIADNSEDNLGFSRRVNESLQKSTADYVALLNDDTVVSAGWLDNMLRILQTDSQVAAAGPLSTASGQWQWVHGMAQRLRRNLPADDYLVSPLPQNLAFWCALFPQWAFETIGLLDERFFMYCEDDDWCIRAQDNGYKLALDLSTVVQHDHRSSYSEEVQTIHQDSWQKLKTKHNIGERRPSVLVAVLTEGTVHWELSRALTIMVANRFERNDVDITVDYFLDKPISSNRNAIVKRFLEGDWDYLLMMDDDQAPIERDPLELVPFDYDIVGMPTPLFNEVKSPDSPVAWNVGVDSKDGDWWDLIQLDAVGEVEVDSVGTGIMLIARRVLEHPDMRAPFLDEFDADGVRSKGLDFLFCRRAKEAGFRVHVHTDYLSEHYWELPIFRMWRARQNTYNGQPIIREPEVM